MLGGGTDGGAFDIDAELAGAGQEGSGELGLEVFGALAEIGFGGTHVCCVSHRVFAAFG